MNPSRYQAMIRAVTVLIVGMVLVGCSAGTRIIDTWQVDQPAGDKPEKVAVIVVLPDGLMRQAIEIDMAEVLQKKGINAVAGSNLPGISGGIRGEIDTEKAAETLKADGADGVIVSFYMGGGREDQYVQDQYYAEYEGTGYGYGWARPYAVDVYSVHRAEDIEDFTITTYVETSYHDLETEQTVWRMITRTKDIEHTDAARNIAEKVAHEMAMTGLK